MLTVVVMKAELVDGEVRVTLMDNDDNEFCIWVPVDKAPRVGKRYELQLFEVLP